MMMRLLKRSNKKDSVKKKGSYRSVKNIPTQKLPKQSNNVHLRDAELLEEEECSPPPPFIFVVIFNKDPRKLFVAISRR